MGFLPINKSDMENMGWEQCDFIFVSGDAYVDHPSFGTAIITRVLESEGFKVGIIAQPNYKNLDDFKLLGEPKYAFLVSSGVIDSMVNNYTASKKRRTTDVYSPGGKAGARPDRALIVYCNKLREAYKEVPIIIGGVEASLRRFAHYDYWDDKVRNSILIDTQADLLVFGMGERVILEIAQYLKKGIPINKLKNIRGTSYMSKRENLTTELKLLLEKYDEKLFYSEKYNNKISLISEDENAILMPSFEDVEKDKIAYSKAFKVQYENQDSINGKILFQKCNDKYVVENLKSKPFTTVEMDRIYSLPYERNYHPSYDKMGGIQAIEEVKFSITSHRGCFGGCNFCSLNFHQGRVVQKRSHQSIVNEAKNLTWDIDFKGYIHDVGGPTANFRNPSCEKQLKHGVCKNRQCLFPTPCKNLKIDHNDYIELLNKIKAIDKIKKVFIRSGIRYDYLMLDKDDTFFNLLCKDHISGQLKVAPEHVSDNVLNLMGKPKKDVYQKFCNKFKETNNKLGKDQYLVPYLISSHPGSTLKDAIILALYLKEINYMPLQVQDFYPTPGTLSTCMYYTELDPRDGKKIYVAKSPEEKLMQRSLLQYRKKENKEIVLKALKLAGRDDLIGNTQKCLISDFHNMKVNNNIKKNSNDNKSEKNIQKKNNKSNYKKDNKHKIVTKGHEEKTREVKGNSKNDFNLKKGFEQKKKK